MKIRLLFITLSLICFKTYCGPNSVYSNQSSIDSIVEYYTYLDNREFKKAYDKSNKSVDFDTYKSWYKDLKDIHILNIRSISETKFNADIILVENDITNIYRYDVTFTMNKDKIVSSYVKDISDTINSSDESKLVIGKKFGYGKFNRFHFLGGNLFCSTHPMGDNPGYYFVIGNKIYLNYDEASIKILTLEKTDNSLFSICRLTNSAKNRSWPSLQQPTPGKIIEHNGYEITIVDREKYDFDILGPISVELRDRENLYRISLLETQSFVTFSSLNTLLEKEVLGFTIFNDMKYFLVSASYTPSHYDEIGPINYFSKDKKLKELGSFVGWVAEYSIIEK